MGLRVKKLPLVRVAIAIQGGGKEIVCACATEVIERNSIGVNYQEESAELNGLRGLRKSRISAAELSTSPQIA